MGSYSAPASIGFEYVKVISDNTIMTGQIILAAKRVGYFRALFIYSPLYNGAAEVQVQNQDGSWQSLVAGAQILNGIFVTEQTYADRTLNPKYPQMVRVVEALAPTTGVATIYFISAQAPLNPLF